MGCARTAPNIELVTLAARMPQSLRMAGLLCRYEFLASVFRNCGFSCSCINAVLKEKAGRNQNVE
jgi:hypothetical protein